jgi:hypothetical protein
VNPFDPKSVLLAKLAVLIVGRTGHLGGFLTGVNGTSQVTRSGQNVYRSVTCVRGESLIRSIAVSSDVSIRSRGLFA